MVDRKIGVIGLGYVGLPLALAFARRFSVTVGFDVSVAKIDSIRSGIDPTKEGLEGDIRSSSLEVTSRIEDLRKCDFFIVGVPTPVDENHNPDLKPLLKACGYVGSILKKGDIVVFESTVYPGVTEEVCAPVLEEISKLKGGRDFSLGYSPERINPGDKEHTFERVLKVVSGDTPKSLDIISSVYESVVTAGVFRAASIRTAEAAKVIENTQRDLNIALMNELAIIFDRLGLRTKDVLDAAGTKWNFLRFSPGLVGGHCIGVDPYYLTTKAEHVGYHPQVILAGRRINDDMGRFVAQRLVKLLIHQGIQPKGARVGVLGLTFKENVSDIRNSRVPDIVKELSEFGVTVTVVDPMADAHEVRDEYGMELSSPGTLRDLDGLILAVPHRHFVEISPGKLLGSLRRGGVFVDVKSVIPPASVPSGVVYWSL